MINDIYNNFDESVTCYLQYVYKIHVRIMKWPFVTRFSTTVDDSCTISTPVYETYTVRKK